MLADSGVWLWVAFIGLHSVFWQCGMLTGWGAGTSMVMNSAQLGQQGSTQGLLGVVQAMFNSVMPTAPRPGKK